MLFHKYCPLPKKCVHDHKFIHLYSLVKNSYNCQIWSEFWKRFWIFHKIEVHTHRNPPEVSWQLFLFPSCGWNLACVCTVFSKSVTWSPLANHMIEFIWSQPRPTSEYGREFYRAKCAQDHVKRASSLSTRDKDFVVPLFWCWLSSSLWKRKWKKGRGSLYTNSNALSSPSYIIGPKLKTIIPRNLYS